jgi:hypothetical protein
MREDRFIMQDGDMQLLSNESLVCKDCKHVYPDQKTAVCEVYPKLKPSKVIYGDDCNEYEKE